MFCIIPLFWLIFYKHLNNLMVVVYIKLCIWLMSSLLHVLYKFAMCLLYFVTCLISWECCVKISIYDFRFVYLSFCWYLLCISWGLPWWLSGKKSTCQCRRYGFDTWVRKILWRREWQPTPVLLPAESHGQRSLAGYSPWGHKDSDTT